VKVTQTKTVQVTTEAVKGAGLPSVTFTVEPDAEAHLDAAVRKVFAPIPPYEAAPVAAETLTFVAPESYLGAFTQDEVTALERVDGVLALVDWTRQAEKRTVDSRRAATWTRPAGGQHEPGNEIALTALAVSIMRAVNWTQTTA
jgi:hypothetical protein